MTTKTKEDAFRLVDQVIGQVMSWSMEDLSVRPKYFDGLFQGWAQAGLITDVELESIQRRFAGALDEKMSTLYRIADPKTLSPEQRHFHKLGMRIAKLLPVLDLMLGSYLRGMGHNDAADLVIIDDDDLRSDPNRFVRTIVDLWDQERIPDDFAVFVLFQVATHMLVAHSPDGYAKDPRKSPEGKRAMSQALDSMGAHRLGTMVRKSPEEADRLARSGMEKLWGHEAVEFQIMFDEHVAEVRSH